ncbi:hypothetical protein ASPZODRAFT_131517 [Penicilliopsis zonata CBS 506.65]|uniref:ATP-dependent DNA helicase n=1 Tax=Penicilliopsis zonata CBS 506.65 TaxID=1073090 RepID=A0A1L9SKX6_9EURO|nr:hypothetical protein ASPZODRAFT_131517 [Penicilliopsis zonata CBS 506.65]OJJ47912.1 hypothetical protein ASPZODRAFT_131517 [Penicilliopsis zonata CBS 506.65]
MSDFDEDLSFNYFEDGSDNQEDNDSSVSHNPGAPFDENDDQDSPRPAKRRRLGANHKEDGGESSSSKRRKGVRGFFDEEASVGSDSSESFDCDSLPSPHQTSDKELGSKYKSFVPKNLNVQENIFVTQLTQPPSSPERIRGPRWKKPEPEPAPELVATPELEPIINNQTNGAGRSAHGGNHKVENYGYDEDELRAAIAASLDSFENEQPHMSTKSNGRSSQRPTALPTTAPKLCSEDVSFNFDDIPEDAFDSSPCLTPPRTGNGITPSMPSASRAARAPSTQQNLRQTTLFGMSSRASGGMSQWATQNCSPPNKEEPPTHHKLNDEAIKTWVYPTNLGKTRDYQFNIAQRGLYHNLLVALPTGLGKTFIAATIMLNWYRWTKNAQIIFVAPTKPLVAQQISACFGIAGIPRSQTTMLTGEAAPGIRAEEWQQKRVFFMTPQTLINDLKTGIADPKRIVLLVVDEAHRATGGYAYVEVVKFLRRFNQSFRVLALTATPGSTVESVQAVIDGLDIAKVEIRTEQSLDIREYVHSRNIEIETFENSEEMTLCMDLFSSTLQPLVDQLRNLNAYWGRDPMALTAFGLTKARQQWMASDPGRNANMGLKAKLNSIFTVLASLAHAIDLLKYHGITPFYRHLVHFQSGTGEGPKNGKYQRQIVQDESFKKLVNHLQTWTKHPEFIGHPKLEYLKSVVLNHFLDRGEGTATENGQTDSKTRIMIFVHFRDSAEEVTRVLKRYEPMIRPHVFVGQSSAKGSEGMDQKKQLAIVEKFKKGTYNTIVATSIGEEGLDIGEVDLIVCYDSSASPIRMLQRMGRTGRKRAGNITLLLMKGKEEDSYMKAKDNYEKMQQMIASGSRFTFHTDISPRILPAGIKPEADKREIEIPPENSQQEGLPEPKKRRRAPKRPPKKFHMPDDVETGFTKASRLTGTSKKTKNVEKPKEIKRSRTPIPVPVDIPSLEDVLLTPTQQEELERRYQNVGGTSPQFIQHPRNDAFPRLQLVSRPTKIVKHGSLTQRIINTLQKMNQTDANCDNRYKQVLALEGRRPKNQSLILDDNKAKKTKGARPKTPKPATVNRPQKAVLSPVKAISGEGISYVRDLSLQPLEGLEMQPFYNSQVSGIDDLESLPDITTLMEGNLAEKPLRVKRAVIEDDSDY